MVDFNQLTNSLGLDVKSGIDYTGGQDKYVSALQRFYKSHEGNISKIRQYYDNHDFENYMIIAHALKSNAKMIGAIELSKAFEELEIAAKATDESTIVERNNATLEAYKGLVEKLKPIGEMEQVKAADEISGEEAKAVADKLIEALDDFDDELSETLVAKLSGFPFRLTQKALLEKASGYIDDFMYDEAAEIIKELYGFIE